MRNLSNRQIVLASRPTGAPRGLENAVHAFQGLLEGRNFGKQLVQISDDPTR